MNRSIKVFNDTQSCAVACKVVFCSKLPWLSIEQNQFTFLRKKLRYFMVVEKVPTGTRWYRFYYF